MGSKVWTAGNLYVNQSGKIVQLMAVARQEGSAQELAIYQEMHAPFTVWAKSLSAFEATYHKMAEVLEEKRAPQERTVEASGRSVHLRRVVEASGAKVLCRRVCLKCRRRICLRRTNQRHPRIQRAGGEMCLPVGRM